MEMENTFLKGLLWGTTLSIPLWLSIIGWIKWTYLYFV
jgi:hypothetical protein